ncbi:hypothetical protein BYT27DRAFT_7136775 [Phlegmacium glaucopus]|nr:hypothetical protein BYT27DRAFT_7136775 [Phlegmacium glaucopus]
MDGNLASTYTLIHAFLTKHSHTKAAQAVKKAAKEVVILKDDIDIEGPQLDEIICQWKSLVATKASSKSTSQSDSDSDSSSSDSSSSSSSSDSSSNHQTKKAKTKGLKKKPSPSSSSSSSSSASESDSSESDSDSSSGADSDNPTIKASAVQSKAKVSTPLVKSPSSESSLSSDSGSESDDESESSDPESSKGTQNLDKKVKPNTNQKSKVERDSSRTLSSGNASSSGSEPESDDPKEDTEPLVSSKQESPVSSDSSSEASTPKAQVEDEVQVTKKRRTDMGGTAVATATTLTVRREETQAVSTGRIKGSNARPGRQVNERFKRVDPTKVEAIMDNRYVAKATPTNDYGQRAHEDLIVTRGQGFRKEKNKKKKGSYRGGEITMESHSFKFT